MTTTHDETLDVPRVLIEQIDWHVTEHLRPRLEGLTDEEYFYDPTTDRSPVWSVHPRAESSRAAIQGGSGEFVIDVEFPEPRPAPFTTIAWRLGHVIVGVLAARSHGHHDGPPADYMTWEYAGTAAGALAQFDAEYARWMRGVRTWSTEDLAAPTGPAEGPFAEEPRATLVAHINRELIHHLSEIALLRDLYVHRA
ncbi:DinB family protein [Brachybacterium hainanense]|uniref:DinB family protein n=1 Tax=Brachybacterium hainanense TaxID=1541174 RepID=A0ABV6RDG0_9MICO